MSNSDVKFLRINLKKRTFILTTILTNMLLVFPTIILVIPGLISLMLFIQDQHLKHSFHRYFGIYALIVCLIETLVLLYLIFSHVFTFFFYVVTFSFLQFFSGIAFLMLLLILNSMYFFYIRAFIRLAKSEKYNNNEINLDETIVV